MEQGKNRKGSLFHYLLHRLPILTGLLISGAAFYILFRIFRQHDPVEILYQLDRLQQDLLLLALAITIFDYLILSGYDLLSIRYIKHPLPYPKIALTSFVAYSFSHNLGFPLLTGGAVRYRLYSSWGLSGKEIGKTVLFNIVTFWLGVFALGAAVLIVRPPIFLSQSISFPLTQFGRPMGFALAGIVATYMIWSGLSQKPLKIRGRRLSPPGFAVAFGQLIVSSANWVSASLVFYILLHPYLNVSYSNFVWIYFLGQGVAAASHVPGGLGVFESVVLLFTPDSAEAASLASLLAYRIIYFFIPLAVSTILFGFLQIMRKKPAAAS